MGEDRDNRTPHADPERGATRASCEFICPGCNRPLGITLRSTMCFAEAQIYCPACERDYQQRRGRWAARDNEEAEARDV